MSKNAVLSLDAQQLSLLWAEICQEMTTRTSSFLINAWAKTSILHQIEDFDGDKWLCTFVCPSSFNALQFEKNLGIETKNHLEKKLGRQVELKFIFNLTSSRSPQNNNLSSSPKKNQQPSPISTFDKNKISTQDFAEGLFAPQALSQATINRTQTIARSIGLRPDFNFETFAVSTSNEMAHVAALSVAKNPGISYNPLFFYGGVGVGKTHLMQAVGNYILSHQGEKKIIYCTGEEFTNSIIRAIQTKQALSFKDKFRTCEVLLIDDIQFIAGKTAVQEEFFHTFNALVRLNHQIVLTSDRPPHEIALLEDRLRSRFEAGLKIDIQQPSFELRTAILLTKAQASNLDLSIEFAQTIASSIDSARILEGVIMRIKSEIELKKRELNQELINEILALQQKNNYSTRKLHHKEIVTVVAQFYHFKPALLYGNKRQKEIVFARHVAMFLLKSLLSLSYSEIGKIFNNRDHTTTLHGVNKINQLIKTNEKIDQEISSLKSKILNGEP